MEGKWDVLPLRTVARILLEKGIADPAQIEIVDRAFVPIVKIVDIATKINIDIVFNATNGVDGANLINNFIGRPNNLFVLKYTCHRANVIFSIYRNVPYSSTSCVRSETVPLTSWSEQSLRGGDFIIQFDSTNCEFSSGNVMYLGYTLPSLQHLTVRLICYPNQGKYCFFQEKFVLRVLGNSDIIHS